MAHPMNTDIKALNAEPQLAGPDPGRAECASCNAIKTESFEPRSGYVASNYSTRRTVIRIPRKHGLPAHFPGR